MADLGEDMISEPMDDQASEASDIVSVYSASSDTPGGELSTQLMFKFHAAASSSIQDHLQVHGCSDFVTEYKQLSPTSARVTVRESASQGMVFNLNGSKINGQYKLTVEPYRPRSKEKEPRGGNESRRSSSLGGNCCLYVGSNLPEYTNKQHLRDHFGKFAPDITNIELTPDRSTKKFKGFGFITFSTHEVATSAMKALNHSHLLGMRIRVNFRKNSAEQSMTGISPSKAAKTCEEDFSDSESVAYESVYSDKIKVIVHTRPKLPSSINSAFKNHFKDFQSDIASSFVCQDRNTKKSRGFGKVFFTSTKAADYAKEKMRGTKILGKFEVISLEIAKEKNKNVGKSSSSPMKVQPSPIVGSFQFPLSDQHSPDGIAEAVGQLSLSDQPVLSKPQDSVIIENLNPEFTESDIQSIVGVPMLSCRRLSDSSNAVLIKCHSKADAAVVVRLLNNKTILDKCISARLASPGCPVLPLLTIPPASRTLPEYQRGVSAMSTESESPSVFPNLPREILQRTPSTTSMESDVLSPSLQSNAQSVKVTHISRNITEKQLYNHFKSAGEISVQPFFNKNPPNSLFQYAYVNYLDHVSAQKAVDLLHKSKLGGTTITVKLSMNKIAPQSEDISDDNFERVLKLNPKQWNSLMLVNPTTGSTLFKEVMDPFNVNRDVTFTPDYQSQSVKFSGKRETAEHAYGYLSKQLDKEFFIDRDKMEALYHLIPNLPSEVLPYGVQIIEYGPTSTVIKFEGPPAGIENAHKRVSTLVTNLCCEYVPMQHDYQMTELEKLRKTILSKQYGSKVFVSISPDLVLRHILPIWSLDRSILKAAVPEIIQLMSVSCSRLKCSSEEAIYIKNFCRTIVAHLSLKVECNEDGILLKGTPEEVEQLKEFFQSTVLNGLLSKKYSFSCKINFKDHIEQSLLQPYSAEEQSFKYLTIMAGKEKSHKKHTQAKRDGGSNFDVYFYCTNKEFFVKVCCFFDRVSPCSKPYSITQEGMEKVVTDMKSCLENKYHIRLSQNSKSSCFIIDALIPADLQSCLNDIREQVGQKVVTTKYINISHSLYLLLKLYKDDIADLKKSCEITCLSKGAGRENCAIRLKGFISQVDEVRSSLLVLLDLNVVEDSFVLHCPAYLFGMWMRRWNQVKEQEEKTKTFVSFSKQASDKEDSILPVNFQIIGVSETCVQEVKTAIISEGVETEEKVFSLTPSGLNCFFTARKDKKLGEIIKDIVYVKQIDRQHNKVTLISPKELSECLETAEEQVRKFVGERASTSYVLCSKDPVVNLILSNSTKSMEFITRANFISRPHQVSVIMQKKPVGLRLSGTEASLSIVKPLMQSVILEGIEKTIGETKVPVKPIYVPLLKSPEFLQFEAKLGSELCVTCSYPKPGRSSKLVSSSELATDTPGQVVKVDICKGDLVYEQVDVIVNAANEDLKHIGGLAKAILDAGGPSIQKDSDDYTTIHKKVKPGTAVCLGSGDLPCKKIVHAVGPRWAGGKQSEEQLLYFSIFESLKVASTEPVTSIAFPAIGTGVFGVPEDVCARMSLKAVRDFFQSQSQTTIMHVKFVLYSQSTVKAFQSALQSELCSDYQPSSLLQSKHGIKPAPPSALSSQSSSVCSWQWTNDQGGFSPYSSMHCTQLEAAYKSNPKGSLQIIINGNNYVIDFQKMVQINSQTGVGRIINNPSLLSSGSSDIQWLYNEGRQYLPYTPQQSASIEKMYEDGTSGQLVINGTAYTIDPVQMCQTNSVTNYKRNVRRQIINIAPSAAVKSETSPEVVFELSSLSVPSRLNSDGGGSINEGRSANEDIIITLKGPHDCLHAAEDRLRGKFKKSLSKLCFDKFPKGVTADLDKKLGQIASRNSVSWSFDDIKSSDGKGQRVMNLEGVYFKCKAALEAIQDEVLTFHVLSASSEDDISFPQEWQQQSKTTEVFPLQRGSSEWTRVYTKFSSTMSGHQNVEISRIQNKWLWEKYASHKKRLDRKNSGVVNEMKLFHGTRSNDPINIYEGEEGFDMRFSAQGMWGMANYFAANASYSNGYSYQSTKGRQMFLVKVLTGDSYQCPSNNALRMPPVKTAGTSGKEVQFAQTRYDTVTGHTNGSQVFMTYDNDKAYPAYLITYN